MSQIKLLIALALLVFLTLLVMYGQTQVEFLGVSIPLVMIVIGSLFVGALLSAVLGISEIITLKKEIKKQKKEVAESKEKIQKLQLQIREFEEKTEKSEEQKEEKTPNTL